MQFWFVVSFPTYQSARIANGANLAFDLRRLPEKFQDQRVFEIALTELQESKLLLLSRKLKIRKTCFDSRHNKGQRNLSKTA